MQEPKSSEEIKDRSCAFNWPSTMKKARTEKCMYIIRNIRDCIELYQLRSSCSTIHVEFAVEARALVIFEIDLPSWKTSLRYWQNLHATRGGGGGAIACRMGSLRNQLIAQLWTRFSGFSIDSLKLGKSWTVSRCVQQQHGEKKNFDGANIRETAELWIQKFVFEYKSFKKELLIGKYFVTKKYVRSKKTENEEVLSERIFTFMSVVLKKKKNGFSDVLKVQIFVSHF